MNFARPTTYGNGVVTTIEQDVWKRPRTVLAGRNGQSALVGLTVDYDPANNVSSVTDSSNTSNNRSYGYDGIDRLTSVTYAGTAYPLQYDGAGNIRRQTFGGTLNYTYNATTNRLTSTSGIRAGTFSYDARGNVTSNGNINFQYDDNSRLICAKCNLSDRVTYANDALGTRISRTKSGATIYLVHALNDELLLEYDPSANARRQHIYLQGQRVATTTRTIFARTTVTLTASQSAVEAGQSITLTARVSGQSPSGTVQFFDKEQLVGRASVINGVATFTIPSLSLGSHSFSAKYSGDPSNLGSTTSIVVSVMSGNPATVVINIINSLLLD